MIIDYWIGIIEFSQIITEWKMSNFCLWRFLWFLINYTCKSRCHVWSCVIGETCSRSIRNIPLKFALRTCFDYHLWSLIDRFYRLYGDWVFKMVLIRKWIGISELQIVCSLKLNWSPNPQSEFPIPFQITLCSSSLCKWKTFNSFLKSHLDRGKNIILFSYVGPIRCEWRHNCHY